MSRPDVYEPLVCCRLREVEALANTAQQEAESAGQELQELQLRSRTDREAAAKELSDAQTDFQQALKGSFPLSLDVHLLQKRLPLYT